MEWLTVALTAFLLIVPVELPDKTFVVTLVLSTRYQPVPVWVGVVAAFGVQCVVAVAAGGLLTVLPERPVRIVAGLVFVVGAVLLLRTARTADVTETVREEEYQVRVRDGRYGWRAALASFSVLFAAEWGDLSQLLTAGLVAAGKPPVPVFVGSWVGLAVVSGAAVLLGRWLLKHVRLSIVHYVAAGVCAVIAVLTLVSAI